MVLMCIQSAMCGFQLACLCGYLLNCRMRCLVKGHSTRSAAAATAAAHKRPTAASCTRGFHSSGCHISNLVTAAAAAGAVAVMELVPAPSTCSCRRLLQQSIATMTVSHWTCWRTHWGHHQQQQQQARVMSQALQVFQKPAAAVAQPVTVEAANLRLMAVAAVEAVQT